MGQTVTEVETELELKTSKKLKISKIKQLAIVAAILIWSLIILRVGAGVTEQEFIDWGMNIFFWVLIIITALLIIELLILTLFIRQLTEAPIVLFGVFSILVTIDVIIVILILYFMGFIAGVPPIVVF